jgi:mitochondrial fission protein ELM1
VGLDPKPLVIWAVSDGRSGIENQVVGLAEAVARLAPEVLRRPVEVVVKRIRWKKRFDRLPTLLKILPRRMLDPASDPVAAPWPDVWIAAGRATLPLSIRMRRWAKTRTLVVQVQDPHLPPGLFDLVLPPLHDRVVGDNVVSLLGSPHRVTPERLEAERARFAARLDALPGPFAAVLVGGKSKAFDLTSARAAALSRELELGLQEAKASLLMTFSRRTPEAAKAILTSRLSARPGWIWNGEGENPYFAFLAAADWILVTEDSINMAAEAASTGKPVFILKLEGQSIRIRRFHEALEAMGAARPYGGGFHRWSYEPLDETARAAREVMARLLAREARAG